MRHTHFIPHRTFRLHIWLLLCCYGFPYQKSLPVYGIMKDGNVVPGGESEHEYHKATYFGIPRDGISAVSYHQPRWNHSMLRFWNLEFYNLRLYS